MAAVNELQTEHSPATVTALSDTSKTIKTTDFTSNNNDLISRLPNEILTHILSFLPTESSVATSVLSTRWHHLWSLVPNLDFRINPSSCPVKIAKFAKFVHRVLIINNVLSVRNVRVRCFHYWEVSLVLDLINALVTREAEIFDLELPPSFVNLGRVSRMYMVPTSFFNQKNLVELKLEYISLNVPPFVCFPSLEIICLKSVFFIDDYDECSMENLLSGCPVLRSLCILGGFLTYKKTLSICSSTLRDVELDNFFYDDDKDFGFKVVIDAPNLRYIDLRDHSGTVYDIINVSSLVKASLGIEVHFGRNPVLYQKRLLALLQKISRVKELSMKTSTVGSFHDLHRYWFGFLPMFEHLTHLDVELICGDWWPILPRILHFTPNLVNFIIFMEECDRDGYEPHELPQCLLSSLENVEMVHRSKDSVQEELICYILDHAMVLKRLSIQTRSLNLEDEANLIEKLQKNSGACQIQYKNMKMYSDEIISSYHIGETNE